MNQPSLREELAPNGTLRVGINYGNPALASRDPSSGELRGVAVDLRARGGAIETPTIRKRTGAPQEV